MNRNYEQFKNDPFRQEIVKTQLKNLFERSCFSICTVRDISKMTGIKVDEEIYEELRVLHCVDYSDMSEVILNGLEDRVMRCLMGGRFSKSSGRIFEALALAADEGSDKTFTEDTYLDAPAGAQGNGNISKLPWRNK